jgi:hypothetical protein
MLKLKTILLLLAFLLFPFFSLNAVYAQNTTNYCGDPTLGITYESKVFYSENDEGSPFKNSPRSEDIPITFRITNPNTARAITNTRLFFGTGPLVGGIGNLYIPSPSGQAVTSADFTITITNATRQLKNIGNHPGELQWKTSPTGEWEHNHCPLNYEIKPKPAGKCQLDLTLKDEYPPNSTLSILFGGTPNTEYTLQFSSPGKSDGSVIARTTTNNQGSGLFNNIILSGNQGDRYDLFVRPSNTVSFEYGCSKPIQLNVAANPPSPSCYPLPITGSSANQIIQMVNIQPSTQYSLELDGNKLSTLTSEASGPNSSTLQFTLNPSVSATGEHNLSVKDSGGKEQCSIDYIKNEDGSIDYKGATPPAGTTTLKEYTSTPKCNPSDKTCTKGGGEVCIPIGNSTNNGIRTAIGCLPNDPFALIKAFIALLIAISGGIAFLLMIVGAFGMVTSAGNPDNLANSRDRFVKAIEGLLFIIFAVLLFRIIGVDLLGLGSFLGV